MLTFSLSYVTALTAVCEAADLSITLLSWVWWICSITVLHHVCILHCAVKHTCSFVSLHPGQMAEPIGIGWSLLVPHFIRLGSQLPVGNLELLVENSLHIIVPLQWRVQVLLAAALSFDCLRLWGGTAAVAPLPFRHSDPALWEPSPSHPLLV